MFANCDTLCQDGESSGARDSVKTWKAACLHRAEEVVPFLNEVLVELREQGYSPRDCSAVRLAMEEAVSNGMRHGNREDTTKSVWVFYHLTPCFMLVEVADEGPGFDPNTVPDPTRPENLGRSRGLGILLMRHFMNWVRYSERGNRVLMCKCPS
jgi:serine/threonine-protein kinase RsbW